MSPSWIIYGTYVLAGKVVLNKNDKILGALFFFFFLKTEIA